MRQRQKHQIGGGHGVERGSSESVRHPIVYTDESVCVIDRLAGILAHHLQQIISNLNLEPIDFLLFKNASLENCWPSSSLRELLPGR